MKPHFLSYTEGNNQLSLQMLFGRSSISEEESEIAMSEAFCTDRSLQDIVTFSHHPNVTVVKFVKH